MLDDFFKVDFLFAEAEQIFIEVEDKVELVATLLDPENGFVSLGLHIQVGHEQVPVFEVFFLGPLQAHSQVFTSLFEVSAFLLSFPVVTEDLLDSSLVELELLAKLVDPDDLTNDLGEVSHLVEGVVDLALVQDFGLKPLDVAVHLRQKLGLILRDGTSDLGPHEELIVDSENLEHLTSVTSFLKL